MFACIHVIGEAAALRECAQGFSPVVELTSAQTAVLDASGLARLYGSPHQIAAAISARAKQMGMEANVAISANPDAAICAARGFTGVHVIPFGDEAKYPWRCSRRIRKPLKLWSAGVFAASTILPRCRRRASPSALAPAASVCANWRQAG
jgi:hypothetical protein